MPSARNTRENTAESEPVGTPRPSRELTSYLLDRSASPAPAFTHIDYSTDRAGVQHTLSWAELAARVRAVAARTAELTSPSARVAILAPQNLDYVIGFLGVLLSGRIAVPLFAPEAGQHAGRLLGALADCAPQLWLTSSAQADNVRAFAGDGAIAPPDRVLAVDEIDLSAGVEFAPDSHGLDTPAYLQYTSGSTRTPAGVVISHRSVVTNAWQAGSAFGLDSGWTCAGWIPFFHDMGLIQLLCLPVFSGARSVFMTPFDFIAKPARWLHQLSSFSTVFTAAPNFAYDYAARKVGERDRAKLDLSGVRAMINGSEPVKTATIERFDAAFGPCGLAPSAQRPSYGLAEATVFVTNTRESGPVITPFDRDGLAADHAVALDPEHPRATKLVAAGIPHDQHVCIADPATGHAVTDGLIGEIWVHGPNVGDGYWQQPQRSAETFGATLLRAPNGAPTRGWLRTGDLGAWHDGSLYVIGRLKDLIIIDGKNHYPQDIEATVAGAHDAIRGEHVAAFSAADQDGVESAAVVAELHHPTEPGSAIHEECIKAVRKAVNTEHDIKLRGVVLVPAGSLRRTSSGKVARAATRDAFWDPG